MISDNFQLRYSEHRNHVFPKTFLEKLRHRLAFGYFWIKELLSIVEIILNIMQQVPLNLFNPFYKKKSERKCFFSRRKNISGRLEERTPQPFSTAIRFVVRGSRCSYTVLDYTNREPRTTNLVRGARTRSLYTRTANHEPGSWFAVRGTTVRLSAPLI